MKSKLIRSGIMLSLLLSTGVIYQNCAPQNLSFAPSSEELASQSRGIGANSILLNGGSPYTSDSNVVANLTYQESTHIYLTSDASCETGGTWEEIAPKKNFVLKSPNALNFVYAKFKKKTGLTEFNSECLAASITHDDIAPTVSISKKPTSMSASASAQFGMKINDDLSGLDHFECLLVGEKDFSNCDELKTYSKVNEGQNRFQVRAVDRAGNRSNVVEYGWLVDTTAPSVSITAKPDAISASSTAVFNFSASDSGSGVAGTSCSLDGAALATCTSPASYSGLLEGNHTFSLQAVDKVGNKSIPVTYTWKSQGSSTNDFSILGLTGGTDMDKDKYLGTVLQPTVSWTTSAGASSYRVSILNSAGTSVVCPEQATTATSFAFSAAQCTLAHGGSYKARVASYTNAGAIKVAGLFDFLVDTVSPVITLNAPTMSEDQKTATFSPFAITEALSGFKSVSCVKTFNGSTQTIANCQSLTKLTFSDLVTGDHTLTVTAQDNANNVATKTITFASKKIVCDPFSSSGIACRQGWKGNLYYYNGTYPGWGTLEPYFSQGVDANIILYMSQIFVPTRTFSRGFPTTDGDLVKKKDSDGGANLVEYFALRLNTIMKLKSTDAAGYYQFALISDDGSKLYVADSKGAAKSLIIDNDNNHSTVMKCSATAIYMDANSRKPAQLDYFQGPKTAIAMTLVYRKVTSATPPMSSPCDENGGATFYGYIDNNTGDYTGSKYQKALDDGWKPMDPENFLLDETIP